MLIVWADTLWLAQQEQLRRIDALVSYWPRSWARCGVGYNEAIPVDWWISFSRSQCGLLWIMRYPDVVTVIYQD